METIDEQKINEFLSPFPREAHIAFSRDGIEVYFFYRCLCSHSLCPLKQCALSKHAIIPELRSGFCVKSYAPRRYIRLTDERVKWIILVEALIVVMGLIVFLVTTMNDLQLRIVSMHFFCLLLPLSRRNGSLGFSYGLASSVRPERILANLIRYRYVSYPIQVLSHIVSGVRLHWLSLKKNGLQVIESIALSLMWGLGFRWRSSRSIRHHRRNSLSCRYSDHYVGDSSCLVRERMICSFRSSK